MQKLGVPDKPTLQEPHLPGRRYLPDVLSQLLLLHCQAESRTNSSASAELDATMHALLAYVGTFLKVSNSCPSTARL